MISLRKCEVVQGEKSKRPCGLLWNPQWAPDNQTFRRLFLHHASFVMIGRRTEECYGYDVSVFWSTWSWRNLKMQKQTNKVIQTLHSRLGWGWSWLCIALQVCLKKIAAQWILCRLESGVMQATWRNHTSEDVNSQWTHPRHHYKHPHCVSFPLPMMCHESWCALKGTKYKY